MPQGLWKAAQGNSRPEYLIDKRDDQWVVQVNGVALLACKQRKMAIKVAKQAMMLLHEQWQQDLWGEYTRFTS